VTASAELLDHAFATKPCATAQCSGETFYPPWMNQVLTTASADFVYKRVNSGIMLLLQDTCLYIADFLLKEQRNSSATISDLF
jgi:hypothetical protein